jgi:hypothetical protein
MNDTHGPEQHPNHAASVPLGKNGLAGGYLAERLLQLTVKNGKMFDENQQNLR